MATQSTPPADSVANPTGNAMTVVKEAGIGSKKFGEPLFGPSIGSVSSGPSWTLSGEKKVVTDDLTVETVSSWIEKSKEPSNPTTTLQALVNLKRPTLRLCPLSSVQEDAVTTTSSDQPLHLHGLEFVYDCDAPKCGIHVHVHLPKNHPDAAPTLAGLAKLQVFEIIQDGGFGNKLTLEDGAVLELARFEHVNEAVASASGPQPGDLATERKGSTSPVPVGGAGGDQPPSANISTADVTAGNHSNATNDNNTSTNHRRRFSHFNFRRLHINRSVSGPALAVVDAERNNDASASAAQVASLADGKPAKAKDEDGVKVSIRLVALDEQGAELASPNEQITYLHIVKDGTKADPNQEDTRPWIVKVVKREATIGPHTFQLHEIYGLSSSNAGPTSVSSPPPHSYPPDAAGAAAVVEENPQSECLLCLSSPREVVLLPCRHLVACRDCALNMVEYGAGGNITQAPEPSASEEGAVAATATAASGGEGATTNVSAPATAPTPTTANPRRKRKPKGWFCPVCRQPYTSMLRLTTMAPSPATAHEKGDGDASGTEDEGEPSRMSANNANNAVTFGEFGTSEASAPSINFRTGFLRTLSGLGRERERPADVENQNQNQSGSPSN